MRTRINRNKEEIFCEWRKRWVRLTPEEWVRQQLLHHMVEQLGYPASLIAVEMAFQLPSVIEGKSKSYRADAVVYDRQMKPLVLIECKAETVPLTQKTLDQILTYNRLLQVPYLILHNGPQTVIVHQTNEERQLSYSLPAFADLDR